MVNENTFQQLVADGYVKVWSKSYCEFWQKGDDVVTISTKKGGTPILNIFEQRDKINEDISKRAEDIYRIACKVDCDVSGGEIIPYMTQVNGMEFNISYYIEEKLCDHWDEENERWVSKFIPHCILCVSENPDPYDDYGVSSWSCELPVELALNGDVEELREFFKKEFKGKYEAQQRIKSRELYLNLFNMDKTVLKNFLETSGGDVKEDFDKKSYSELLDYLKSIGVDL